MTRPTPTEIESRIDDLETDVEDVPPLELIDLYQPMTLVDVERGIYRLEETGELRRAEA